MVSIPERVADGATALDQQWPCWTDHIDLNRLRMSWGTFYRDNTDSCGCVLAQLDAADRKVGDFLRSLEQLAPTNNPDEQDAWAITHGFASHKDEYEDLTREWSRLIETRTQGS